MAQVEVPGASTRDHQPPAPHDDVPLDLDRGWDRVIATEELATQAGSHQGQQRGRQQARAQGLHLGYQKGLEVGARVGFYRGFAQAWQAELGGPSDLARSQSPSTRDTRALKVIGQMIALSQKCPPQNAKDQDSLAILEALESKFKMTCSLLQIDNSFPDVTAVVSW